MGVAEEVGAEIVVGQDSRRVSVASLRSIFRLLFEQSASSPDPSTHNAAMLEPHNPPGPLHRCAILAYNKFAGDLQPTPELLNNRDLKLAHMSHAESGAIHRAARNGISTLDSVMYCLWAPCYGCARGIIDAGIHTLVTYGPLMRKTPERWLVEVLRGVEMVKSGGVRYVEFNEPLGGDIPHLFDGKVWYP